MRQVTLTSRAREVILQAGGSSARVVCGLLIGHPDAEGLRVTRALPCPNVADPRERGWSFVIDPRAVLNVRRSLRGAPESILGFFYSRPDGGGSPSAADLETLRRWPETIWLIAPGVAGDAQPPRGWWLDEGRAEPREIRVGSAPVRMTRLAACPE